MKREALIREARESELPAIEELLKELVEAVDSREGIDLRRVGANCLALNRAPGSHVLVARPEARVVGFINFTLRSTVLHAKPSGSIDELVVTGDCRGQGIGRRLVEAAVEKCRELGCSEIEVSTEKANRKAREFYKRLGFGENAVLLERELG